MPHRPVGGSRSTSVEPSARLKNVGKSRPLNFGAGPSIFIPATAAAIVSSAATFPCTMLPNKSASAGSAESSCSSALMPSSSLVAFLIFSW